MPFGLKNASGTYQGAIDIILSSVKRQFDLVWLDCTAIISKFADEHIDHVLHVLTLLNDARVAVKPENGALLTNCTDYVGNVINPGYLAVS